MTTPPMIELREVSKTYGDHLVLDRVTLRVVAGTTTALVGPSGCGKTTTLKLINRLLSPATGQVLVQGQDIATVSAVALRRRIGYVVQEAALFPHMTARANVEVVPRLLAWREDRIEERVRELFALVGLAFECFATRYPAELSGGQRQRVGLARALAADPELLLMDEPFGALDPLHRHRLQGEFQQIQREIGKTVVIVTHDMDEAFRLADQVVVLDAGKVQQVGSPQQLRSDPATPLVAELVRAHAASA